MEIRIVNLKNYTLEAGEELVRVDRTSVLGNPFFMRDKSDTERNRVCDEHAKWLEVKLNEGGKIRKELNRILELGRNKKIAPGCWCAPLRCHAETIKRILIKESTMKLNDDCKTCELRKKEGTRLCAIDFCCEKSPVYEGEKPTPDEVEDAGIQANIDALHAAPAGGFTKKDDLETEITIFAKEQTQQYAPVEKTYVDKSLFEQSVVDGALEVNAIIGYKAITCKKCLHTWAVKTESKEALDDILNCPECGELNAVKPSKIPPTCPECGSSIRKGESVCDCGFADDGVAVLPDDKIEQLRMQLAEARAEYWRTH